MCPEGMHYTLACLLKSSSIFSHEIKFTKLLESGAFEDLAETFNPQT